MLMCNFFIFQHFVEDFYAYACERCFSSFGITVILALENELKSVPPCFIFLKEIVLFLPWMIGRVFQHNYMIPEFYCWKVSSYELSLIDTRLLRLLIYEDAIVVYAYKEMYPLDLIPQNKVYVISFSTAPIPCIPLVLNPGPHHTYRASTLPPSYVPSSMTPRARDTFWGSILHHELLRFCSL